MKPANQVPAAHVIIQQAVRALVVRIAHQIAVVVAVPAHALFYPAHPLHPQGLAPLFATILIANVWLNTVINIIAQSGLITKHHWFYNSFWTNYNHLMSISVLVK